MEISNKSGVGTRCKCGETVLIDTTEHDQYLLRLEAAFLEAKRCPTCNGAGKLIDVVISRKLGRVESERVCPLCEGKGEEKAREALDLIRAGGVEDETQT